MFFKKYLFGDTAVYYAESPVEGHDGKTTIGLAAYPSDVKVDPARLFCDSLVQVAFTGDEGLIDYTFGQTMRNRAGTLLKIEAQTSDEAGVTTVLTDGRGNRYRHVLTYSPETGVFCVQVQYENASEETRSLEMLETLSLSGIMALSAPESTRGLTLHRMTSAWSRECRLQSDTFSNLGLDMSWARYGVSVEKWGEAGSMPNRGHFPFAAIEDARAGVLWGVLAEAPFSWQMEVYQEKESCSLSCGMGDYAFAHWRKNIPAGATFTTPKAYFTVKRGDLNAVCNAFVKEQARHLSAPAGEEEMPVLFNEYCTTWGCPSEENVRAILKAIRPLGVRYFVIDCGWYKPDDKIWLNAIGDWEPSKLLFPNGIRALSEAIREEGLVPGIWFEFENAGRDSAAFYREDLLLKRDGVCITSKNRRFFDLRKEEVRAYIASRVADFLRENAFGYIKIDYNDTYGIGCDGAESLGEGGRLVAEESLAWLDELRAAVPDLVIENCSSGGSRIEPRRMGKVSMCSFSDAHECNEIPLVAANVSRVVPAQQSQIWAVLRDTDTPSRTIYSLCAAMIGRICLSGDVRNLSAEKLALLQRGLAFYRRAAHVVRDGEIRRIDCDVEYYRDPVGRQIYVKDCGEERLIIVHLLKGRTPPVVLPLEGYRLTDAFTDLAYCVKEDALTIDDPNEFRAGAFLLKKES